MLLAYRRATLHISPFRAIGDNPDMVTDRTPTVYTHDHTAPHALCPVCPQAYPGAFRHPQDVIDMVLRQVETVDTAKNALAMALHWLEDLVIYLVRVYMDHARTLQAAAIHVTT